MPIERSKGAGIGRFTDLLFGREGNAEFPGYYASIENKRDVFDLFALYREYIKHQYELLNHRTTWMNVINGILLGSYGAILLKKLDIASGIKTPTPAACVNAYLAQTYIDWFLLTVFVAGVTLGLFSRAMLVAAIIPIDQLNTLFGKAIKQFQPEWAKGDVLPATIPNQEKVAILPLIIGGIESINMQMGRKLTALLPVISLVVWLVIMVATILVPAVYGYFPLFGVDSGACPT